jgi:hypothetical protein
MWTRKLKDHAFKVHLSPFFRVPGKVTGVDKALFRQLGEALEMVGRLVCGPSSGANDLLDLVNSRIRFPRQCSIPMECTLAMREVDIAMGWKLVDSPQVNPLNNPACLLHWRVLLTTVLWLDRTRQEAVREYTPVLSSSVCRYEPSPAPVVQNVPTFSRLLFLWHVLRIVEIRVVWRRGSWVRVIQLCKERHKIEVQNGCIFFFIKIYKQEIFQHECIVSPVQSASGKTLHCA